MKTFILKMKILYSREAGIEKGTNILKSPKATSEVLCVSLVSEAHI